MKCTTVFARQFALAKTHFRLSPKIQLTQKTYGTRFQSAPKLRPVRLLRVGKASSQKTKADIPNIFPLLPLVTSKTVLSEVSENVDSLFRQRKSNLFVSPPPLATNTTLITATLKPSDSMSLFQKYEKVKRPTLLVTKGDTSNVDDDDGINRVDKNTELEMITCIVPTNEDDYKKAIVTEIKDGENDSNDNRILINGNNESGNIEDTINVHDTNNVDDNDGKNTELEMITCIVFTNEVIDGNDEEDTTNRQNTSNDGMINHVDKNREINRMITCIVPNEGDYKKAVDAEIKDNESENNDNMTLVIDGNDGSGNIKDTEKDTINRKDTNNVNNNDGIINRVDKNKELDEMITCIVPTNKGDYKKAIVAEIKDGESDNNDNNSIINCVDKNRELNRMITCIAHTNEGDYKKAIVAEIKDGESDNNDNMMLVINGNDESGNIKDTKEDTINRKDTNNVDDNDGKNTELEMITCIVPTNKGDYKKAIIAEIKDGERNNNDNMTLVIDGNDESGNIVDTKEDMTNGQDISNVDDNNSIINRVDKNKELDGMIKKTIVAEIKANESDNNNNMTLVIDRNDRSVKIEDTDTINGKDTNNVDDNDGKNTELEMITYIVPSNKGDYKKAIVAEIKDSESDNNNNMMLVIDGNNESSNLEDTENNGEKYEDTTNGQDTSNIDNNDGIINRVDKNRELGEMITCIIPMNEGDYKKAIVAEVKNNIGMHINKDSESDNNDNGTVVIDGNDEYGNKDTNSKVSNGQVKNIDAKGIIELLVACFTEYHGLIKAIWKLAKVCFQLFKKQGFRGVIFVIKKLVDPKLGIPVSNILETFLGMLF
ncbi:10247_t:CDS:2 [Ambispora gerdemannii]|uniref:10247_t:CDS:1 n=1 Tax=Ambispora gerdemannii TaxID=144530 RepID=A0A9N9BPW2_9GLOM|nr:10247_t:CDS:2 [Ambispora gerdemannii]